VQEWEDESALGPMRFTGRWTERKEKATSRLSAVFGFAPKSKLLFARLVIADHVGACLVRIAKLDGTVIGVSTVRATDAPFHAWMPFGEDSRTQELMEQGEDDASISFVANRRAGIAAPSRDGVEPVVFEGLVDGKRIKRSAQERRPRLFLDRPHPGLKLKLKGTTLAVTADKAIISFRAGEHFLTRWWVNGKPFSPKPIRNFPIEQRTGLISFDKRLDLKLNFDPSKIGRSRETRCNSSCCIVQPAGPASDRTVRRLWKRSRTVRAQGSPTAFRLSSRGGDAFQILNDRVKLCPT